MAAETTTKTRKLSIAVLGAGVIGQVYAALLWEADLQVTLVARGARTEQLHRDGIRYRCVSPEPRKNSVPVPVKDVGEQVEADVLILTVRAQDLGAALEQAERIGPHVVVTLMNMVDHRQEPQQRFDGVMKTHAFPGIGGYRDPDGTIVWAQVPQQPTTIDANSSAGELVRTLLRKTGLPTATEQLMQHWLHTHSILIAGLSAGLLRAGGDPAAAAHDPALLREMVASLRDGLRAYRKCGGKVRPMALATLFGMPPALARNYWRREFLSHLGQVTLAPQIRQSQHDEVPLICQEALRLTGGQAARLTRWLAPSLPPDDELGPDPADSGQF